MATAKGPTPESSPQHMEVSSGSSTDYETLLKDARHERAESQYKESSTLKRQADESKHDRIDSAYTSAYAVHAKEGVRNLVETTKLTKAEIIDKAAEHHIAERIAREQALLEAARLDHEGRNHKGIVRMMDKFRHNRKIRLGIAIGTFAAAALLTATGLGAAAMGVKLGQVGLRATAAYFGSREGMDRWEAARTYRGERKVGGFRRDGGELEVWKGTPEEVKARAERLVAERQGIRTLAKLESPQYKEFRPEEEKAQYELMVNAIRQAEIARIAEDMKKVVFHPESGKPIYFRKDLIDRIPTLLKAEMSLDLHASRQMMEKSKKAHRVKKGAAIMIALVAGATGMAKVMDALHIGGTDAVQEVKASTAHVDKPGLFDRYPGVAVDYDHSGHDTAREVARKHLQKIAGWDSFTPQEKVLKEHRLANMLVHEGDKWRYTRSAIKDAFFYHK